MFFEEHLNGTQLSEDIGESWQPPTEEETVAAESTIDGDAEGGRVVGRGGVAHVRSSRANDLPVGRGIVDDDDYVGDVGENEDDDDDDAGDAEGDDLLMRALTGAGNNRSTAADRTRSRTSSKSLRPSPALVRSLIQHAESERYCPDLLIYPERLIDSVVARIAAKQEEITQLSHSEKEEASARYANAMESQAPGDKSGGSTLPFKKSDLLAIEVQRITFFLTELIRCRVRKIEKLCFTIAYADVVLRDLDLERERRLHGKPRWSGSSGSSEHRDPHSHRTLLSQERDDAIRNACFLTLFDDAAGVVAGMPASPSGEAFSSSVTESRRRMELKAVEAFAPPRLWQSVEPTLRSRSTALNSRTSRSSVGSTFSSEPTFTAQSHAPPNHHSHHDPSNGTMDTSIESTSVIDSDVISYESLLSEEVLSYFQRLLASLSPNELVVAKKLAQLRQQTLLDSGLRHFPQALQSLTPYVHSSLCFAGMGREHGSHTPSPSMPPSAWLSGSRQWAPLGVSASIGPLLWNRFTDACMSFTLLAEGEEILRRSNPTSAYVFVMTLEDLGDVDLGDGAVQPLRTGEMLLVPYSVMQSYVQSGKACLV